jgi:hypothetical protein
LDTVTPATRTDARYPHRLEFSYGSDRAGSSDRELDILKYRFGQFGSELPGHRPPRRAGYLPESGLKVKPIHFHHHTVDIIIQRWSQLLEPLELPFDTTLAFDYGNVFIQLESFLSE